MGASQLKRLKASLKEQGLVGPSDSKKKKSKNVSNRKNNQSGLESIREAFNPFDVKVNRQKHDVLGRTVQGAKGRPERSKQLEEDNRIQAFNVEKGRKNKIGGVVDRRFGENDTNMTPEEKMQERFTREMQMRTSVSSKKGQSLFDLDDDDDDDDDGAGGGFVPYGQSLSLTDDYKDGDDEHDDDDEEINEIRKKRMRMRDEDGGVEGGDEEPEQPERKKSKNEVMKEVIAKSKMHKMERQQAKEDDLAAIEELNADGNIEELYKELSGINRSNNSKGYPSNSGGNSDAGYDRDVRQLAFERRAVPSDRTKTEEELAKEESDKRKELERKRLARMNGELDESDEEYEEEDLQEGKPTNKQIAGRGNGDDLEDDALQFGFKQANSNTKGNGNEEGDGAESEDDFGDILDEDIAASNDEVEEELESGSDAELENKLSVTEGEVSSDISACPSNLTELIDLLSEHELEIQPKLIDKVLSKYHPRYAQGNKEKQGEFTNALVDYVLHLADSGEEELNSVLDSFVFRIKRLADTHSESLASHFREKLKDMEERLTSQLSGSSHNEDEDDEYLSVGTLLMFTLIGIIFSASDHFHLVVTPAQLLMCQHLSQTRITTTNDMYSGLYLCNIILAYQGLANRFVPEVISFLGQSLYLSSGLSIDSSLPKEQPRNIFFDVNNQHKRALAVGDFKKLSLVNSSPLRLSECATSFKHTAETKSKLLLGIVGTIDKFSTIWKEKTAFIEMVTPLDAVLSLIENYHPDIKQVREKICRMTKLAEKSRVPLTMQSHKPIPLPSIAPQFEENYNVDKKSYDSNKQRQDVNKLKAEVKKERKGALRDIRKDTAFMSREQNKEKRQKDREYHEKLARLERTIATEEGAEKNKYEREKKARKTAGKK